MNYEKELERHKKVLEQISNAEIIEDLPKIVKSSITTYLATNAYFGDVKLKNDDFKEITDYIMQVGTFDDSKVKEKIVNLLKEFYPFIQLNEIEMLYTKLNNTHRVDYLIKEIESRENKIKELERQIEIKEYEDIMNQIDNANELSELPKISRTSLHQLLINGTRRLALDYKTDDIRKISNLLIEGHKLDDEKVRGTLLEKCIERMNGDTSSKQIAIEFDNIMKEWLSKPKIYEVAKEINAYEKKVRDINLWDHERAMNQIKSARRIRELPFGKTISSLTSKLSGNSIIYSKQPQLKVEEFKKLAYLLINGNKLTDDICQEEIIRICKKNFANDGEASKLLTDKFLSINTLPYLIEEVALSTKMQEEFIGRMSSNVNVYMIPNPKAPIKSGRFYNCYISDAPLDLKELPLNLDEIVPKEMDVDAIEWYVQENYDKSFKNVGGIILNQDETIGEVNVFSPNAGTVGIKPEELDRYSKLDLLRSEVEEIIEQGKKESEKYERYLQSFLLQQQAFFKHQQSFLEHQQVRNETIEEILKKIEKLTPNEKNSQEEDHGRKK